MTPKKLARIQTHLANEATGSHPQNVTDVVLWSLIEDASEPPSDVMDAVEPCRVKPIGVAASDHASGGEAPLCVFGPGGDFRRPWPQPALIPPPWTPGARSSDRAPGHGEDAKENAQ